VCLFYDIYKITTLSIQKIAHFEEEEEKILKITYKWRR
jgi:hypothetical protein